MTERERLIELLTTEIECDIDGHGDCSMCKYKYSDKDCERHICNKLADHLLSNGVIVPPCKVGDEIFEITIDFKRVASIKVPSLATLARWVEDEAFGLWLFLTREEAEEALKRRKRCDTQNLTLI